MRNEGKEEWRKRRRGMKNWGGEEWNGVREDEIR